jgi:hypothetical protein
VTLAHHVIGMLWSPRATLESVVAAPRWVALLALLTALTAAALGVFYATEVGRLALVDQWERTALALGQPVDDGRYADFHRASGQAPVHAATTALMNIVGVTVAAAAVAHLALRTPSGAGSFAQTMAVSTHAATILALRSLIGAPLGYLGETTANPMSLGRLFPNLNDFSPVARVLGSIDLFVVWWAVVFAIGLAVLYRRKARPLALACLALYVAVVMVAAGVMALTGGTV